MTGLGAIFLPSFPPERLRGVARAADAAGLEQLWLWEDCFKEAGISAMAAALAWTERLRVGIGLLPVPMRNVAIATMEAATLDRLFPGRAILGVGHGVQDWMGQIGARAASPLTLLGEHLDAMHALLAGERVTVDGRYVRLRDVALDWPPASPPPLWAGAEGPKTLLLAGAKADGVILSGGTPQKVRWSIEQVRAGAEHAGRPMPQVALFLPAAFGAGAADRLAANQERWKQQEGERFGLAGEPDEVAAALTPWIDAGVDTIVLQPMDDEADPEEYVRIVATAVRPLLR